MENTVEAASPSLGPEADRVLGSVKLRLITAASPLWTATESDLAALEIDAPFWGFWCVCVHGVTSRHYTAWVGLLTKRAAVLKHRPNRYLSIAP